MQHLVPLARMAYRVGVVLAGIYMVRPDEILGALAIVGDLLLIDCLIMHSVWLRGEPWPLDEHSPAVAVAASKLAWEVRASMQDAEPPDPLALLVVQAAWCAVCLCATAQSKLAHCRWGWAYAVANLEFCVFSFLLPAEQEGMELFCARAAAFAALTAQQYAAPLPQDAMIGARGYLVCFLPVLAVRFDLAMLFAGLAMMASAYSSAAASRDWPRPVLTYYLASQELP